MGYDKFQHKTICKVSRNCEGLTEINLFIELNALKLGLFLLLLVVYFSFLFLALLFCHF